MADLSGCLRVPGVGFRATKPPQTPGDPSPKHAHASAMCSHLKRHAAQGAMWSGPSLPLSTPHPRHQPLPPGPRRGSSGYGGPEPRHQHTHVRRDKQALQKGAECSILVGRPYSHTEIMTMGG